MRVILFKKAMMNILYIAPMDRQRTGLAEYSEIFKTAVCGTERQKNVDFIWVQKTITQNSLPSLRSMKEAVRLSSVEPDLIHAEMSSSTYFEFWYAYFFSKKFRNIPLVLTVHDSPYLCLNPFHALFKKGYQNNPFFRVLRKCLDVSFGRLAERYLSKRASHIFVTTKIGTKLFACRFDRARVSYLPHVPFKTMYFAEPRKEENFVLFNGFIIEGKGIEVLLRAFGKMKVRENTEYSKLRLVVCGRYDDGSKYFRGLKQLAGELGVSEKVDFTGFKSESELRDLMERALCVVLPYYSKKTYSSSGVLIKAMSMGIPVLVTNIEMLLEYVQDGVNGLVFDEGDDEDLLGKLLRITKDKDLRARFSAEGRKYVDREHFSGDIAKKVMNVYGEVTQKMT